ncbi:hypothetical protein F2Q69_00037903 [Brassica cretica]|uniref:Uncharacterized protein n=1 Tax=Brassica cretica TaxID=69181 RepID=A0A8S9SJ58_BRACR|nr:hypothetical protein F2Q69_00037903 [Brassica cretica]
MVSPVTVQEVINLAVQDAKEWQSAQAAVASSARNLSAGPPSLPTFDNEKLVCFVDAAWDASTRNCGIAGVFKGRQCLTGLCPRPVLTPIKIPLAGFDHASSHLEPKADLCKEMGCHLTPLKSL